MSQSEHFAHFHYCPRCGANDVHTPNMKLLVCRACDFHYYTNAAAAVIALIHNEAGDILFVRRGREPSKGKLDLPGGFVDPQETIENALTREIKEELGLDIAEFSFLASFPNRYLYREVLYHTVDCVFVCTVADLTPLLDTDEIEDVVFIPPNAVDFDEIGFQSVRSAIRHYQSRFPAKESVEKEAISAE